LNTLVSASDEDVVWLTEAGAQRWVVITHDDRIRYNQLEKQAVLPAKFRFLASHFNRSAFRCGRRWNRTDLWEFEPTDRLAAPNRLPQESDVSRDPLFVVTRAAIRVEMESAQDDASLRRRNGETINSGL
jgi:hypothetical protein